jgi:PKD domain/Carbohydrate binding domain
MKKLLNDNRLFITLVVAIFFAGCIDENTELPKVTAGFTHTVNETGTVTFLNTSIKSTKYLWDFGDDNTSTEINPVKNYTPGTYFVSLTAFNEAGASGIFKDTLTIVIKDEISLPITFDNTNVDYVTTTFNGASFAIVDNPNLSGTNNVASKVGAVTNSGNAFEGFFIDVETQIDLATNKTIAMNILANAPVNVLLKLEEGTSGAIETTVAHTGTGWENLSFNFTSSAKYSRVTLFIGGATPSAGTFAVDDIEQKATVAPTAPATAAPTPPTRDAGDVISLFSGAYTNVTVDTWRTDWSSAVFEDVTIAGNATKKYSALDFVGVETQASKINATAMTHVHVDVWSADFTQFSLKLVNFGTTTTEHQVDYATPAKGEWISYDIPLTSFTGLAARADLAQYIFVGRPIGTNTIFLDNIYFYRSGSPPTTPTTAAPTPPVRATGDVISLFSGAYTNVAVDTWRTIWSSAVLEDVTIAGNATKKYSGLDFVGVETVASKVNATGMTHVHVDVWSPDFTQFSLKLVNFGTATTEHQVDYATPAKGEWISYDIPLTSFTGLAARGDLAQYIFVGRPIGINTIFIDNFYFYKTASGGGGTNIANNGDFETGTDTGWMRFQNGGTSVLDNTINNGGTWSGKLATGGPSNPAFKQERIGTGTVKAGDVVRVRFDHKGSVVQPGAVFNVLLFGEGASGASFTHVFNPAPIPGTNWTTFTGTFTIGAGIDVSQGISFLIEAVCGGDAGCSVSANIDNVTVVLNP